ncbi:MAG: VWA domain-containing protein [Planctomycetes bacterium]|nr:VWA domain-containing protein [Planctomycetota bacterium]
MRHLYERFDPARHGRAELERFLKRIFHQLLVRTDGDVDEALRWLEILAERHGLFPPGYTLEDFRKLLEREREIQTDATTGDATLTGRGAKQIRRDSLELIFQGLRKSGAGDHRTPHAGGGGERLPETKPYQFGDDVSAIDWLTTYRNAASRVGAAESLNEEDFEVFESEHKTSCATVLLLDISHSMTLYGEDRMTPAKSVAFALQELIESQFPKDAFDVVLFGDEARRVRREDLPFVTNGPFHTNTRAGLRLARELLLRGRAANRQIFMITDGKPSAITEPGGEIYKNPFGLDRRIVNKTLEEAAECKRKGIIVTTFMVASDPQLVQFIEELTRLNRGRAYFASLENLGEFVFADYLRNRRRRVR